MFKREQIIKATSKIENLPMPDTKVINISEICIAPYQRKVDPARIRKMTKNFLPKAVGAILVSYRDGKFYCVDGQHRLETLKGKGYKEVYCNILTDLDYIEECLYFTILNTGLAKLSNNQIFTGLVEGRDSKSLALVEMFSKYGFEYNKNSMTRGENTIGCVKTFEIIRDGSGMYFVEKILRILRRAWFGNKDSLKTVIVKGLKTFINERVSVDEDILVASLEKHHPNLIIAEAIRRYGDSLTNLNNHNDNNCYHVAKLIEDLYDKEIFDINNPVKRGRPRKVVS